MTQLSAARAIPALLFALALGLPPAVLSHQDHPPGAVGLEAPDDEEDEMARLLAVLDKYTEIATKTRLNADFVPGMVTVLEGEHLAASGKRNVWEALAEVPGFLPFVEGSGSRNLAVRGAAFESGKLKVLVNGIPQNNDLQGQMRPVMSLPVAQVERIEVIRGPGSVVHGEYAYDGVINVITHADQDRVFLRAGEDDSYEGGAMFAWSDAEGRWRLSLNLSAEDSAAGEVTSGADSVVPSGLSNAPGPVNDARDARSALLAFGYRDFALDLQYLENGLGDQFGTGNALPPPDDRIVFEHKNTAIEARQRLDISSTIDANLRLGWFRYEFVTDESVAAIAPGIAPGNTLLATADYEEEKLYAGLTLEGRMGHHHDLLLDIEYQDVEVKKADGTSNNPVVLPNAPFIDPDASRSHFSVAVQDQIAVADDVTVTAGLRYDDYNDVGSELSPRLAAVWRLSGRHILKAQYAEAFRPPTFFELYTAPNPVRVGNPEVEPMESATFEVGYIFKGAATTVRTTLFHTKLSELIRVVSGQYENTGDARLRGVELELEHRLSRSLSMNANASFTDTEDRATNRDLVGAADWLANLGLRYQPRAGVVLDAHYRYVDDRARSASDTRSPLDGYQTLDLSASFLDVMQSGLTLRGGVRNLFDEDYADPASPGSYPDDYPQRGRQWWLQASFAF